jgi:hypothetical protein
MPGAAGTSGAVQSGTAGTSGTMQSGAATEQSNASAAGRSRRLPGTASPLPMLIFASLGAFALAGVTRALRASL